MTTTELKCPKCGEPMRENGSVFVEWGEWDGRSCECEGDVKVYACSQCAFQLADVTGMVGEEVGCDLD
jgi:hypothetical protein